LTPVDSLFLFEVYVQPGAKSTELSGYHGERLKIRLKANPVDDQANQELISFLAKTLGIGKKDIAIVRGKASRIKTLSVSRGKEAVKQLQHRMLQDFGS
jgi:uncharacterized protein (TIGR00251 family)